MRNKSLNFNEANAQMRKIKSNLLDSIYMELDEPDSQHFLI